MIDVLIIEDDEPTRTAIRGALETAGFAVADAPNGRIGIEILERGESPDLVLLDLAMPEMDGYEVLVRLRRNSSLREIPVVVVTAMNYDSRLATSEGYLKKPVRLEQVVEVARTWCLDAGRSSRGRSS